jgi:hypothetical protein
VRHEVRAGRVVAAVPLEYDVEAVTDLTVNPLGGVAGLGGRVVTVTGLLAREALDCASKAVTRNV